MTDEVTATAYWCRHIRQPVRFAESMKMLHEQGYELFVEIGPEPVLLGLDQCLPEGFGADMDTPVQWLPSLSPKQSDWEQLLESLGILYVHGVPADWSGFDRNYSRQKVTLPTYPFQRQRFWVETGNSKLETGDSKLETLGGQDATDNARPMAKSEPLVSEQSPDVLERVMSEQIRVMSELMSQQLDVLRTQTAIKDGN